MPAESNMNIERNYPGAIIQYIVVVCFGTLICECHNYVYIYSKIMCLH